MSCNDVGNKDRKGLTLIESVTSIFLLTMLMIGLLSTFFLSKTGGLHARHRIAAMNTIRQYMEQEVRGGYDGGVDGESDYYTTVTDANPIAVTIDNRGTADPADDLMGTIVPDPYFPDNIENADGTQISYCGIPYKIIGFIVSWTEDRTNQVMTERSYCYASFHSGV